MGKADMWRICKPTTTMRGSALRMSGVEQAGGV
jgi:hypothetical protein